MVYPRFSRLRVRILLFIAFLVLPLLLVLGYFSSIYRAIIVQELRNDALELTRAIANRQEYHINGSREFLLLLSQISFLREEDWETCNRFYREIFPAYQDSYTNIGYVDAEGDLKCSVVPFEKPVNLSDQGWFIKVRDTRQFAIGDYLVSALNNELVISLGMPVFSEDGEWGGVVGVALSLKWLNEMIAETFLPERSVLTITDHNGIILARQIQGEPKGTLNGVGEQIRDMAVLEELEQLGEGVLEREIREEQQLVGFTSLGEGTSRLYIILTIPLEVIFAPTNELAQNSLLILGAITLLSLFIGAVGSHWLLVSPVNQLVGATVKLARGDFSARAANASNISELQLLADNFNHMVSALQQRETELRRSEHKFRSIFDNAFQFMALISPDGRVIEMNAPGVAFNNIPYTQIVGAHFGDMPGWKDKDAKMRVQDALMRAAQGEFVRYEEQVHNILWPVMTIDLSYKPMLDEQGAVNMILVEGRDITEVKKAQIALHQATQEIVVQQQAREASEKANQLKLKFLAMVSHELRTPLTSIKGLASTLMATDVEWDRETIFEFIGIINDESDRLTNLVEQLLDMSSMEAGTLRINKQATTFAAIFEAAAPQMNVLTRQHELITDIQPDLPEINVDVQRISQVIINLISNAAKYSPAFSRIRLTVRSTNDAIQVEVDDEGKGIPPEEHEMVFQAFRRAAREETSQVKGAGLGLSICRALIQAHGGQIWIADKPAPGTRICFTLPC